MARGKRRRGGQGSRRTAAASAPRGATAEAQGSTAGPSSARPSTALSRGLALLPWALPVVVLAVGGAFFYAFTMDDAYITVRYAENLLRGEGLVFNPGERVEGYSSPLHVVVLAALGVFGVALVDLAKVLGLAAAAATALCVVALARRLEAAWWLAGAAGVAVALHPGLLYYASSGLETTLYTLLVTAAALRLVVELKEAPGARRPVSLWLLGLAAVTRPEGALLLALGCGCRLWRARTEARHATATATAEDGDRAAPASPRRAIAAEALARCLPAWAPLALWVVIRRATYGEWLPNVYYAKPSGFGWEGLGEGVAYLHGAVMGGGTYLAVGLALAALLLFRPRAPVAAALLLAAVQAAAAVYSTGDWMIEARYALPAIPIVIALAAASAAALTARRKLDWLAAVAAAGLLIAFGARATGLAGDLAEDNVHDHAHRSDGNAALGRWLADNTPEGATVVTDEIGAIGYYSKRHIMDKLGLVDPEVAQVFHRLRMNPYSHATTLDARIEATTEVAELLVARHPDYVLIDYEGPITGEMAYDRRFINLGAQFLYQRLGDDYRFVHAAVLSANAIPPKTFLVFERATGPEP